MAMGIFEGHMAKMAEGFKADAHGRDRADGRATIREARASSSPYFDWQQFTDEELRLLPAGRLRSAATARCTTSASRTCRA